MSEAMNQVKRHFTDQESDVMTDQLTGQKENYLEASVLA